MKISINLIDMNICQEKYAQKLIAKVTSLKNLGLPISKDVVAAAAPSAKEIPLG